MANALALVKEAKAIAGVVGLEVSVRKVLLTVAGRWLPPHPATHAYLITHVSCSLYPLLEKL
jgi:hypothetical protein